MAMTVVVLWWHSGPVHRRGAFWGRAPQITACAFQARNLPTQARIVPQKKVTGPVPLVYIWGPVPPKTQLAPPPPQSVSKVTFHDKTHE